MSTQARRKTDSNKKGAGCAPFFTALALIIIIMVSVILALIVADVLHITSVPLLVMLMIG